MDPSLATIIGAAIGAASAISINLVTNIVMSNKQTAVIQNEIKHLKEDFKKHEELPDRVTRLETQMTAVNDAIREMRIG